MTAYILVEGGGSGTRAALVNEKGQREKAYERGPSNPVAYGIVQAAQVIVSLAKEALAGRSAESCVLYAALAGAAEKEVQAALAQRIGTALQLRRIFICPDLHAMLLANAGAEEGILVISGTGASVLAKDRQNRLLKVGGWGAVLGDEGSAYNLAVSALRTAARAEDQIGQSTILAENLTEAAGLPEFSAFSRWISSATKREVAALAPAVLTAAEQGDLPALQCVEEEAWQLALRVCAAHEQLRLRPDAAVYEYGGLLEGSMLFRQYFHQSLDSLPELKCQPCACRGLDAVSYLHTLEKCPDWASEWTMKPGAAKVPALPDTERAGKGKTLDELTPEEIVAAMQHADMEALQAVGAASESIAAAVDYAGHCLKQGGRLIYTGAGTSGRLGVLDASECPPTFGVSPDRVVGLIAGGDRALRDSVEGAEDDPVLGAADLEALNPDGRDFVIGIAASGTTPYVAGALSAAARAGARTALITSSTASPIPSDYPVVLNTGPEVLTGSTRLKAGTAAKLVLNRISTGAMAQAGLIYKGRMVGMAPANIKLRHRAERIVSELTGLTQEESAVLLNQAGGRITAAVVMGIKQVPLSEAEALLEQHGNRLREIL